MHQITLVLDAKPQGQDDAVQTASKAQKAIARLVSVERVRVLSAKEVHEDA